jgi:FkbM family methyltransferase
MNWWLRWKRWWRNLETATPVVIAKYRIRQVVHTEPRHLPDVSRRTARYGEWILSTVDLRRGAVAYCVGVGDDVVLDQALIDVYGLEVHAFDPTPRSVDWVARHSFSDGFHFHPVGVAAHDGEAAFAPPSNPRSPSFRLISDPTAAGQHCVTCPVRRLITLRRTLGHDHINLLKIDIEGAEYDVLADMLDSGVTVDQLLVEFHHRFKSVGRRQTTDVVTRLRGAGYRIFSISPNGREYSFVRSTSA